MQAWKGGPHGPPFCFGLNFRSRVPAGWFASSDGAGKLEPQVNWGALRRIGRAFSPLDSKKIESVAALLRSFGYDLFEIRRDNLIELTALP
jgi:hypothetical protein